MLVARTQARWHGGSASFVQGDIADLETSRLAVLAAVEDFGHLDIVVNNAAIDLSGVELVESPPEDIRRVFEVNALGAIFMIQEAAGT